MFLQAFWQSVANWPLSQYIASSTWAFPTFETIHVIAIVTVIGTVLVMDLRLLGLASNSSRVTEVSGDTLRWTWVAFVVAACSGGLLFISKATDYMVNPFFLWKMGLILVAGVNMLVFHALTWPSVGAWDSGRAAPRSAKIAGALSLLLWIVVVVVARAIGFTLDIFSHS